jgi:hypothetical protein
VTGAVPAAGAPRPRQRACDVVRRRGPETGPAVLAAGRMTAVPVDVDPVACRHPAAGLPGPADLAAAAVSDGAASGVGMNVARSVSGRWRCRSNVWSPVRVRRGSRRRPP